MTRRAPPASLAAGRPDGPWGVGVAATARARARGLLGRWALGAHEGLWLPSRSVHTFGMRLHLDLVWLDRAGAVVRLDRDVGPGALRTCLRARGGVVEVAAGRGPALAAALAARGAPRGRAGATAPPPCPRSGYGWRGTRAGPPSR